MAGETQDTVLPLPKSHFQVTFANGLTATFQEASGLDEQVKPAVPGRGGPAFAPIKMPGLAKVGNATLRKGVFADAAVLWAWVGQIDMNTIARETVVVTLLDETAAPKMVWTLNNAWPTKVTGTTLQSEGNEVAVESLDIAFETMVISAP